MLLVCTQNLLNGLGFGLGSQFICNVGFEFPTKGNSLLSILTALFNSHEFLSSPLQTSLYGHCSLSLSLSLSFTLFFYLGSTTIPFVYSLPLFIA